MNSLLKAPLSSLAWAGVLILLLGGHGCSPPIDVEEIDGCAVLDVQYLGEYQTPVEKVSIVTSGSDVLWSAQVKGAEFAEVHFMKFCPGTNTLDSVFMKVAKSFRVSDDTRTVEFELEEGTEYRCEVVSPRYMRPARMTFVLGGNPEISQRKGSTPS
jgi:hypothetical protein